MHFVREKRQNELWVSVEGNLDSNTAEELESVLREVLEGETDTLVLDLTKVDYISSKGVRVAISLYRGLKEANKHIRLVGMNNSVKEVFRISGLAGVFGIED